MPCRALLQGIFGVALQSVVLDGPELRSAWAIRVNGRVVSQLPSPRIVSCS